MSVTSYTSTRTLQQINHSNEWPVQDPACFELRTHDKIENIKSYNLNVNMFSKNEFHLFWTLGPSENRLIARALEFFTFHPSTPLNQKFNVTPLACDNFIIYWCSFPLKYKDECVRAAKTFNFRIERVTKIMVGISEKTSQAPALTLAEDHKERLLPFEYDDESQKPISKDALCIPVKKKSLRVFCEFPQARNFLWFKAEKPMSAEEIDYREEETSAAGNFFHQMGVD